MVMIKLDIHLHCELVLNRKYVEYGALLIIGLLCPPPSPHAQQWYSDYARCGCIMCV
jgi:hypothetical protein